MANNAAYFKKYFLNFSHIDADISSSFWRFAKNSVNVVEVTSTDGATPRYIHARWLLDNVSFPLECTIKPYRFK